MPGAMLIGGATSDAGKTVLVTGICRMLARHGVSVAPFKAQNMSNNSMVTSGGAEIGRAQWVQSVAAGVEPDAAMNPVLLKPASDRRSHVVLRGAPAGRLAASEFAGGRAHLAEAAYEAFAELRERFEVVICEGAGSIAEINLRAYDYVNLGLAQHARMPVLVAADIDRGGVLASLYGTLALLAPADQELVAGFVVNRFRGELELLRPGLRTLESLTGRPVVGVVPWQDGLWLDSEDALTLADRPRSRGGGLRVAVVAFPRISNFTDIEALALEPDVDLVLARRAAEVAGADLLVVPGTRATLADLAWARERGIDEAVRTHAASGRAVLGICGGAQMLGGLIEDPEGIEGAAGAHAVGWGLLDLRTRFGSQKVLGVPTTTWQGQQVRGYLIHHGRLLGVPGDTQAHRPDQADQPFPGGVARGGVRATMWHGLLENDHLRREVLHDAARRAGRHSFAADPSLSFAAARTARLDLLADLVEEHLGLEPVLRLAEGGPPPDLPFIPAGPR